MRLFISYARVDKVAVKQLCDTLRYAGHDPWYDDQLIAGSSWSAQLAGEIARADAMIYVMTPESVESEWCKREIAEAERLDKPIIPLLYQERTSIPPSMESRQYIDFSEGQTPQNIARLTGALAVMSPAVEKTNGIHVEVSKVRAPDPLPRAEPPRRRVGCKIEMMVALVVVAVFGLPLLVIPLLQQPVPLTPTAVITPTPAPFAVGIVPFNGDCPESAGALAEHSTITQTIEASLNDPAHARETAAAHGLGLLIWGSCSGSRLTLNFELMTDHTPATVADLASVSEQTSASDTSEAEDIIRAVALYAEGGAENYQRAAELLGAWTVGPQLSLLRGNSLLFQGSDHYVEALNVYQRLEADPTLAAYALNNIGVTYLNRALAFTDWRNDFQSYNIEGVTQASEAAIEALENAEAVENTTLRDLILLNQAQVNYLLFGEQENYERALQLCQEIADSPQSYICRAAARYSLLYEYPESGDPCSPMPDVQPILDDLAQAGNAPEAHYWRFRAIAFRLQCLPANAETTRQELQAQMAAELAAYQQEMAQSPVLLEADLLQMDTKIQEDAAGVIPAAVHS